MRDKALPKGSGNIVIYIFWFKIIDTSETRVGLGHVGMGFTSLYSPYA